MQKVRFPTSIVQSLVFDKVSPLNFTGGNRASWLTMKNNKFAGKAKKLNFYPTRYNAVLLIPIVISPPCVFN